MAGSVRGRARRNLIVLWVVILTTPVILFSLVALLFAVLFASTPIGD